MPDFAGASWSRCLFHGFNVEWIVSKVKPERRPGGRGGVEDSTARISLGLAVSGSAFERSDQTQVAVWS
jgi:hypothetical protein